VFFCYDISFSFFLVWGVLYGVERDGLHLPYPALTIGWRGYFGSNIHPALIWGELPLRPWMGPISLIWWKLSRHSTSWDSKVDAKRDVMGHALALDSAEQL